MASNSRVTSRRRTSGVHEAQRCQSGTWRDVAQEAVGVSLQQRHVVANHPAELRVEGRPHAMIVAEQSGERDPRPL